MYLHEKWHTGPQYNHVIIVSHVCCTGHWVHADTEVHIEIDNTSSTYTHTPQGDTSHTSRATNGNILAKINNHLRISGLMTLAETFFQDNHIPHSALT